MVLRSKHSLEQIDWTYKTEWEKERERERNKGRETLIDIAHKPGLNNRPL